MSETVKKAIWLSQLERLINQALQLDEATLEAVAQLSDQIIAFELTNTNLVLFLRPATHGLAIDTNLTEKPHVLIKGTLSNFLKMMLAKQENTRLPTNMQIIGDIGLAQQFQKIMQSIDIDWEEHLSKLVGDQIAYKIGTLCRASKQFAYNTSKILSNDLSEYLRFEKEILPDHLLVEEFCHDVDILRQDVDRLTQRIDQLETTLKRHR